MDMEKIIEFIRELKGYDGELDRDEILDSLHTLKDEIDEIIQFFEDDCTLDLTSGELAGAEELIGCDEFEE